MEDNEKDARVKFYSTNDLSIGFQFCRIESILNSFNDNNSVTNINEIIELYNIQLFFNNDVYSRNWTAEQKMDYAQKVQKFPAVICKFFSSVQPEMLNIILDSIEFSYVENFWELLTKYHVYKRIAPTDFSQLAQNKKFRINDVLKCKPLVRRFSAQIVLYMENNNRNSAELLLSYFLEEHERQHEQLYFPSELTKEIKRDILDKYIDDDLANANYLKLIFESNSTNDLPLSDRLKLKAKRSYDKQIEQFGQNSAGMDYGVKVSFENQKEDIKIDLKERMLSATYSRTWVRENTDYPTLLNNFIYLFGYTDLQFRSLHVHRDSQRGIFEKYIFVKGKKEYFGGIAFQQTQMLAQLQIIVYCKELENVKIQLEDIIKWFFEKYLVEEFDAHGFVYNSSSKESTYLEKCRNIAAEIDSILKQFKLWCEDGKIDFELLHMSSEHIFIRNIPSRLHKKYVYPLGNDYKTVAYLLFSNQSMVYYIPEISEEIPCFYELLNKKDININMFEEHQLQDINWLKEHKVIEINEQGRIIPCEDKIWVLYELYEHDVLCTNYLKKYKHIIDELEREKWIEYSSSLFSRT